MLKTAWTLDEICLLPLGEHDFFDRKSGQLLNDSRFRQDLAKAISAFSNSGGGHLILGVADDGSLDGVPKLKGRTPIREWLEQTIANLVEPTPTAFRVHCLDPTEDHNIPNDGVVVVIDFADSHLAPFQSRETKIYYYRVGGHSVPAPHFYLETLRNRLVAPVLSVNLNKVRITRVIPANKSLFVQLLLDLQIENMGNVTPQHWHVDLKYNGQRLSNSGEVTRYSFPPFALRFDDESRIFAKPILPGQSRVISELIGLSISNIDEVDSLPTRICELLNAGNTLSGCVITETVACENCEFDLDLVRDIVTPDEIRRFAPQTDNATKPGSLGGGINSIRFAMDPFDSPDDHANFNGIVENSSEEHFKKFKMVIGFFDENNLTIASEICDVGNLPPGTRRHWDGWIKAAQIWNVHSAKLYYYDEQWCKRKN